jgi:hypothetical protein
MYTVPLSGIVFPWAAVAPIAPIAPIAKTAAVDLTRFTRASCLSGQRRVDHGRYGGGMRFVPMAAVAAVLVLASTASAGARTSKITYRPCRHEHLSARGGAGFSIPVTHLGVSRISCSRAAAAVRAGRFELTPGGPLFSTPGFVCSSPVGPPLPGTRPRYFRCTHRRERFEFLVPGSS